MNEVMKIFLLRILSDLFEQKRHAKAGLFVLCICEMIKVFGFAQVDILLD